jgi:ankyrin repeat protein
MVGDLLAAGVNPDTVDKEGVSLLMSAAAVNDPQLVRMLLEAGADIGRRDNAGWDALCLAAFADGPEVATILLQNGADPYAQTKDGNTPFTYALNYGSGAVVEALINSGLDLDRVQGSQTPLGHAILLNDTELARQLLGKGAGIDAPNRENMTPLMYALIKRNAELIELFLEQGADINVVDMQGRTALHYALDYRQPDIATRLIEMGAAKNVKSDRGTPLSIARERGYTDIIELLLR